MVCRKPFTQREVQIIHRMKHLLMLPITHIAKATDRNKCSVYKALKMKKVLMQRGRPKALTPKDVRHLVAVLKGMVKKAKACYEITLAMLVKRARVQVCERTVREALKKKNIKFRKMRSKPILTNDDKKARLAFARKYKDKTCAWWVRTVHLHIDLKNFAAYTHAKARAYAAQREVRGAYRSLGQGLDEGYVLAPKELKYNPGPKSIRIAAGVGNGRVLLWTEIKGRWNGQAAADFYKGPMLQVLKRTWPRRRSFLVLEDNDPSGFKSRKGVAAKLQAKVQILEIPKRSPDLNICDYALWKQVTRTMRKQERRWPTSRRETRAQYVARLARAARGLKKSFVVKAIGDMKRRCQRLYNSKGGHFEEGGRRS